MIREAVMKLGFRDMYEVSLGADFVSKNEGQELLEHYEAGEKMTTSCCPAFVSLIKKHLSAGAQVYVYNCFTDDSYRTSDQSHASGCVCVFIGPCIAKKSEVIDSITFGGADYAMTYEELASMFEAKNIDPEECTENLQQGSKFGKQYSVSGGVTAAVLETFKEANKEVDLKVKTCSGAQECKKH